MTIREIQLEIEQFKPMSVKTIYTHLHALRIKPVSKVRQCPQRYPTDTPQRLLKRLGITPPAQKGGVR